MLDKYYRVARLYPAIICALPLFVLNYFLLSHYLSDVAASVEAVTDATRSSSSTPYPS